MREAVTREEQSLFIGDKEPGLVRCLRNSSLIWTGLLALVAVLALTSTSFAQSALTDDANVNCSSDDDDDDDDDRDGGPTINSGGGSTNCGARPILSLSPGSHVYVKFKLSSTVPVGTPGSSVTRATLKLFISNVAASGTVDLHLIAGSWTERTITAHNVPQLGDLVASAISLQSDKKKQFLVVDVTPAVQQWLGTDGTGAGGLPNEGVALVARGGLRATFDSKENTQTSHEPHLNIQLRSVGGLQRVERDGTLSGDGTDAEPLGVANQGIGTAQLADSGVTAAKVAVPLLLSSSNTNPTLAVENNGSGPAISATGAIDTSMQYNIGGNRILTNAGMNNLFAGVEAGASNSTGTANAFFGKCAGFANSTGSSNSFFGFNAGRNTTSSNNSFFGDAAGFNNTTGGGAFFGFLAGFRNTTGFQNSFFGRGAGVDNTTGSSNSFFGDGAGSRNITGHTNSFFGFAAGFFNTTGANNAFLGGGAGHRNTTGSANAFFGEEAGSGNLTGSNNSFFGRAAGFFNTTGSDNVFVGLSTGLGNTTGSNITVIGTSANVGTDNLSFATALGAGAIVSTSNAIVLGRSADTVQIPGALNVSGALSVSGTFGASVLNATTQFHLGGLRILSSTQIQNLFAGVESGPNATGLGNVFFGPITGLRTTTGSHNSFFGLRAGASSTGSGNTFLGSQAGSNGAGSGSNNTFVGHGADINITQSPGSNNTVLGANAKIDPITNGNDLRFATAIGAEAKVPFSDMIILGKPAGIYDGVARPADIVRTMGIFQPALGSPGGNPVCFNNGLSLCSSSFRYKTGVRRYFGGLDVAKRLNPITFAWKNDGRRDIGFGAEEVAKVEPLLTFTNEKGETEGVHYAQITTVLVNAVKEQQAQIEALTKQIENLTTLVCQSNSSMKICRKMMQPK